MDNKFVIKVKGIIEQLEATRESNKLHLVIKAFRELDSTYQSLRDSMGYVFKTDLIKEDIIDKYLFKDSLYDIDVEFITITYVSSLFIEDKELVKDIDNMLKDLSKDLFNLRSETDWVILEGLYNLFLKRAILVLTNIITTIK